MRRARAAHRGPAGDGARPGLWSPTEGIARPEAWPARRAEILADWERWITGPEPPAPHAVHVAPDPGPPLAPVPPAAAAARPLVLRDAAAGWALRAVLLLPGGAAPSAPVPALLTPTCHARWAAPHLARGLAVLLVAAGDAADDTTGIAASFPRAAASRLALRAWALSRGLDALAAAAPEVDPARVAVAGHSRNGKTALLAAARDPRIAAAVLSSSGVLGAVPARLACDRRLGEGVELLTRHFPSWYAPALRRFRGREHHLPTDAHELLATVAPRPLLVACAEHDPVEDVWAVGEAVGAARDAFRLLGAPGALELRVRAGDHAADDATVAGYAAWLDAVLRPAGAEAAGDARPPAPSAGGVPWPRTVVTPRALVPAGALPGAVAAALGAPARSPRPGRRPLAAAPPAGGAGPVPRGLARRRAVTRSGVAVDVWLRPGHRPGGLVLWCPPLVRPTGYRAAYERGTPLHHLLAADGLAVAAHDPVGTGARLHEAARRRAAHRGWSPLGRMLHDARESIAPAASAAGVPGGSVWVVGFAAGALTALHLAALDPRVAGAVLVAPGSDDDLLRAPPRYGLADLLAAVGPRPVLVLAPREDATAAPGAVAAAARRARRAGAAVTVETVPVAVLDPRARERTRAWIGEAVRGRAVPAPARRPA